MVAQPNRVFFAEILGSRELGDIQASEVACRYVEKLSKLDYQSVGINLTGYTIYPSEEEAYQYLCHTLLSGGAWQEFGEARMKAGLQLAYTLNRGQLNLGVNQATITLGEQTVPGIVFSGNFSYDIVGVDQAERTQDLERLIQNWKTDLDRYQALITQKFINQPAEVFAAV